MTPLLLAMLIAAQPATPPLDVYFHSDVDGEWAAPTCTGAAATPDFLALLSARERAQEDAPGAPSLTLLGPNSIAPDLFTRRLFSRDVAGAARGLARLLHGASYRAYALGSHELGWEPAWLEAYVGALEAEGIGAAPSNLTCDAAATKKRPGVCRSEHRVLTVDVPGFGAVAVFFALSPSLWAALPQERRAGLTAHEPKAFLAERSAEARRQGAKLVVAFAEVPTGPDGVDEIRAWQTALASGPHPDVILAAGLADDEGRRTIRVLRQDGAPPVVGSTAATWGWSRLRVGDSSPWLGSSAERGVLVSSVPATAGERPTDPRLSDADIFKGWIADYCATYGRPLGPAVRGTLTYDDFVHYVLEVMRRTARAEIALINRRFVKSTRFPWRGAVTEGQWAQALPYPATLGVATLTGAQVEALLGRARGKTKLAVAGLPREGPLTINGRPLDATRAYRVATIAFVAEGGDGLFEPGALPWKPLPNEPDVAATVRAFLQNGAGREDGDPTVDAQTDFGPPASQRLLAVAMSDLDLGLSSTTIDNGGNYTDTQLARAEQRAFKADWNTTVAIRTVDQDMDGRFRVQYGWTKTAPAGQPAASSESVDLVTATWTYADRRLRRLWHPPAWIRPDPYARLFLESELTRPDVTPTQLRTYHHAELTATLGAAFTPWTKLHLRVGPGARRELLASGPPGDWRFALEAGATLDPWAIATVGHLPVRFEGTLDFFLLEPTGAHAQQLRASSRLSFPLLPPLFLAVGVDLYGAQYGDGPWDWATDATATLRVHWDRAYQSL